MRHKNIKNAKVESYGITDGCRSAGRGKGQIQENRDFSLPCISHNVHYTKIKHSKIRPPFSSGYEFSGLKILMAVWCWVQNVIASSPLVMLC